MKQLPALNGFPSGIPPFLGLNQAPHEICEIKIVHHLLRHGHPAMNPRRLDAPGLLPSGCIIVTNCNSLERASGPPSNPFSFQTSVPTHRFPSEGVLLPRTLQAPPPHPQARHSRCLIASHLRSRTISAVLEQQIRFPLGQGSPRRETSGERAEEPFLEKQKEDSN